MPRPLKISSEEIALAFSDDASRLAFPPILSLPQFAKLFGVSVRTVKAWIAAGDFDGATTRAGKHRRVCRSHHWQFDDDASL